MKFIILESGQKAIYKKDAKSILHNHVNVLGERPTVIYNKKQAYTLETFLQMCKDYITAEKGTRLSSIEIAKQIVESNFLLSPPKKESKDLSDFDKKIIQALNYNPKK